MLFFNGTPMGSAPAFTNRATLYGDAVFETVRIVNGKALFAESHYFRLMAAMRICRMEIPMEFTLEYVSSQWEIAADLHPNARVRMTVLRNAGGKYLPTTREVSWMVEVEPLEQAAYSLGQGPFEVELYKDACIPAQLLSTLKTTNRMVNVLASIFAQENGYQSCLLINDKKNVIEAISGNLFMRTGTQVITPALSEGCMNGIMRQQLLKLRSEFPQYEFIEGVISPFDLQKADELFITNVIQGVQAVSQYRKKQYTSELAPLLVAKINQLI